MQTFYDTAIQIVRGLGKTKVYVVIGIGNALLIALFSIVMLIPLGMQVDGILLANIMAKVCTLAILEWRMKILRRYFRFRVIDKSIGKELLRYSLPLIPAAMCWSLLDFNNIFFVKHYLGLEVNGVFGVVRRFSNIIYVIAYIFYQTWQQNAIEQYRSADRDKFFSMVFNNYFYLLAMIITIVPYVLRLNYFWLVGAGYQAGSQYLFLCAVYVMELSLCNFFELGYQCSKQTQRILPSLGIAIVLNVVLNIVIVPRMGLYGTILTIILTLGSLIIYRAIDTRKYMRITFHKHNFATIAVVICSGIAYYTLQSRTAIAIALVVVSAIYIALAPKQLRTLIIDRFKRRIVDGGTTQ